MKAETSQNFHFDTGANKTQLYLWSGGGDHHIGHEVISFIHALHKMQKVSAQPALVENRKQKFLQSKLFLE